MTPERERIIRVSDAAFGESSTAFFNADSSVHDRRDLLALVDTLRADVARLSAALAEAESNWTAMRAAVVRVEAAEAEAARLTAERDAARAGWNRRASQLRAEADSRVAEATERESLLERARAASVSRMLRLEREIEAALARVPAECVVRVCEGGGPEDIAASLAVTVANLTATFVGVSEACDSLNEDARRIERLLGYEHEAFVVGERTYTIEEHIKEHVLPARALTEAERAVCEAAMAEFDAVGPMPLERAMEFTRARGAACRALRAARAAGKDGAR